MTRPEPGLPLGVHEGVAPVAVSGERLAVAALVDGPLGRTVARIALPAVASTLLMTVFGTADAYWVGTRIGGKGLAAVSTSVFWIWLVIAVAELFGVGLTAVASRSTGERRPEVAAAAVGEALVCSLVFGAALAVTGLLTLDHLFAVMHAPAEIAALGRRYLGTYLAGAPLIFGFIAVDAAFRAAGDTRTPFMLLAASVAVALALDPVLILGLGPAPRLGIGGAAVATLVPRGLAFLAALVILRRRGLIRAGGLLRGAPGESALPRIVQIGLPTAVTGVAFSLIYVFLTRTTSTFGTPALAALGIGHRVESWVYMVGVGFGAATAAIVGQNLGARRPDRAEHAGWVSVGFATTIAAVGALAQFFFAAQFAGFFTSEAAVVAEGARYLRIAALSTVSIGPELVLEGALGGAGATLPPMLTSTALTAVRVPLAVWAAARWGPVGIWWVISLTAFGRGLAMVVLWKLGRWKR